MPDSHTPQKGGSSTMSQNHFRCGLLSVADEFRGDGMGAVQEMNLKSEEVSLAAMVHEWREW